jgi:hypothetical protein
MTELADAKTPGANWCGRSKELTTADSSRVVVATAAKLDTMCLMRGVIPFVMFVVLSLSQDDIRPSGRA